MSLGRIYFGAHLAIVFRRFDSHSLSTRRLNFERQRATPCHQARKRPVRPRKRKLVHLLATEQLLLILRRTHLQRRFRSPFLPPLLHPALQRLTQALPVQLHIHRRHHRRRGPVNCLCENASDHQWRAVRLSCASPVCPLSQHSDKRTPLPHLNSRLRYFHPTRVRC